VQVGAWLMLAHVFNMWYHIIVSFYYIHHVHVILIVKYHFIYYVQVDAIGSCSPLFLIL
jgi:hypothetical protein